MLFSWGPGEGARRAAGDFCRPTGPARSEARFGLRPDQARFEKDKKARKPRLLARRPRLGLGGIGGANGAASVEKGGAGSGSIRRGGRVERGRQKEETSALSGFSLTVSLVGSRTGRSRGALSRRGEGGARPIRTLPGFRAVACTRAQAADHRRGEGGRAGKFDCGRMWLLEGGCKGLRAIASSRGRVGPSGPAWAQGAQRGLSSGIQTGRGSTRRPWGTQTRLGPNQGRADQLYVPNGGSEADRGAPASFKSKAGVSLGAEGRRTEVFEYLHLRQAAAADFHGLRAGAGGRWAAPEAGKGFLFLFPGDSLSCRRVAGTYGGLHFSGRILPTGSPSPERRIRSGRRPCGPMQKKTEGIFWGQGDTRARFFLNSRPQLVGGRAICPPFVAGDKTDWVLSFIFLAADSQSRGAASAQRGIYDMAKPRAMG